MAVWVHKFDVSDLWGTFEEVGFERFRDQIVERLRAASFFAAFVESGDADLPALAREMSEAEDQDDFNFVWSEFYDWADINRVWVDTFSRAG